MHFANAEEARKHHALYWKIFFALIVLTGVTVAVAQVHIPSMLIAVAVAMFVALIKGGLVVSFFMHLTEERKSLFAVLLLTIFFFGVLMSVPILTHQDSVGTVTQKFQPFHGPDHGDGHGAGEAKAGH